MILVIYGIIACVFAFIAHGMAKKRGREAGLWAVLGFIFGIFAIITLVIMGASSNNSAASLPAPSKFEELAKLKELLDQGVLSQEEFDVQKKRLLS